ncbi:hypothetical protein [Tindallia californiensis]|uniref:Uncharacterized protein n=1 Tax=Tindallia californiensis TaxID=159292 RepID=A0A1H3PQ28_9FIRM|nr:hypothetical protein [Tindallia californiensis]SDZ03362.1 hypothetical protein SAMN05192546_10731 [Tindallia californiensis]
MKKTTTYILVAALIVLQLYSLVKINSLQSMIENTNNTINSVENRLDNQINSIYQNVDQKLEAQASLIHNSTTKVGKLDIVTITIPITFTIEPKIVTETMSVALDFNGEIVRLEKSGLQYSTTKNFEISDSISPKIIMEDDGVKNIEEHMGLRVSNIREQVFPFIFARFSAQSSYGSNEYRAKGHLDIDYKPSRENNNTFIDMKYVIKVDDEIIKETPVVWGKNSESGRIFTLDIDDKYSINDGQILTSNIVAVDSFGFTHEYLVTHFVVGSNVQREPYLKQEKIIAPNGKIVYLFDENNYEKIN